VACPLGLDGNAEVVERTRQTFAELNLRLPSQQRLCACDVGPPLLRVIARQGLENDLALGADKRLHLTRTFQDRPLVRIADVHRVVLARFREPDDPIDEVGHVAETSRLRAVAVNGQRIAAQRLHHQVRNHAAVVSLQPRPVGVEDSHQVRVQVVIAPVRRYRRLGEALRFVIHRTRTDRIHTAPVALHLRMHLWVAVAL